MKITETTQENEQLKIAIEGIAQHIKENEKYNVTYRLEPTGKIPEGYVITTRTDGKGGQIIVATSKIDKLVEEINKLINELPEEGDIPSKDEDSEGYAALQWSMVTIGHKLDDLKTMLAESECGVWELLDEGAEKKYNTVLNSPVYKTPTDQERLEQIEARIVVVQKMDLENLDDDVCSALKEELTGLALEVLVLRDSFTNSGEEGLFDRAETARQNLNSLIALLDDGDVWIATPNVVVLGTNDDPITLKWQWNDQGIQQVGASRPTGSLFGEVDFREDGPVYTTDQYMRMVVYVMNEAGDTQSMTMWSFLHEVCGYEWNYIYEKLNIFADMVSRPSDPRGGSIQYQWGSGRLITAFENDNGEKFTVSYGLEPVEAVPGYQVTQTDEKTLTATPVTDFDATVVWYDNRNQYVDSENGKNVRPEADDYITDSLKLMRFIPGQEEPEEGFAYTISIEKHSGDDSSPEETWDIHITDLPKYGPNGERYTYCLVQETNENGVLPSPVSTGAAYTPVVYNGSLLDPNHPEYIYDGGKVTNTLGREGKVVIKKVWKDGDNKPEDRPAVTMYFYRVAETEVVQKNDDTGKFEIIGFEGSPVPGYDSISGIEKLQNSQEGEGNIDVEIGGEVESGEYVTITLPADESTLPMFDNYGRRYIYYAIERMSNQGDYVTEIDDSNAGPLLLTEAELALVREAADSKNYILNGAVVTNKLESTMTVPVTVTFNAQAIQNNMENTSVELQLQYYDTNVKDWVAYSRLKEDGTIYNGTLTLDGFRPENMTMSGSSEPVDKYDSKGYPIQYRWVQTDMEVNDGVPVEKLKGEDQENVALKKDGAEVGPGVGGDKTTLYFDIEYTQGTNTTTIVNTLVGNTQLVATKSWSYSVTDGDGNVTETYTYPGNWDGGPIDGVTLPAGAKWPKEIELTYNVLRNGAAYLDENGNQVVMTMAAGKTKTSLAGLPRYDEKGNEYTYTFTEKLPEGWGNKWGYKNTVENDLVTGREEDRVTQVTGEFGNYIGPGDELIFDVRKEWKDDTDIETRYPVQVAVFNIQTGEMVKGSEQTLDLSNGWYKQIAIKAAFEGDSVDKYIVKETRVNGVDVAYRHSDKELAELARAFYTDMVTYGEPFAANKYKQWMLDDYIAGTLAEGDTDKNGNLEFYYNVYLSVTSEAGRDNYAVYTIYNQRFAELEIELTKTWTNDYQESEATFVLERQEGNKWVGCETFPLSTDKGKNIGDGKTEVFWKSVDNGLSLPKFDAEGVHYNYRLRETGMAIKNDNGEWSSQAVEGGVADFSTNDQTGGHRYSCSVGLHHIDYAQSKWLDDNKAGDSPHHSGDLYVWSGSNVRQDSFAVTVYKVWRDGAGPLNTLDPVNRPDICFRLYRLSYNQLLKIADQMNETIEVKEDRATSYTDWMKEKFTSESSIQQYVNDKLIERVNEDYFWSTSTVAGEEGAEVNNWLWECELSENVERYATDGSPYIYFLFEEMRGNSDGYQEAYCNLAVDELYAAVKDKGGEANNTEETFSTKVLESSFMLVSDGGTKNSTHSDEYEAYYACVVVNTRQREAHVSGKKTWNIDNVQMYVGGDGIPYEDMPEIKLKLYRAAATVDKATGEFVPAKWEDARDAGEIDTLVVTGENEYVYNFPSDLTGGVLPRYDAYGYRYSYWITEEPITSYSSESMFKPEEDNFNITNTFEPEPPYVKIALDKTWVWPNNVDTSKKNLTVTFELHAVMVDKEGKKIDGIFGDEVFDTQTITLTNGNPNKANLTFVKATSGSYAGKNLPYYAPNGKPYCYYIVEIFPNGDQGGYKVTAEVTDATNATFLSRIGNAVGSAVKGFLSLFSDEEEPEETYGDTGLILPVKGVGDEYTASVNYKNEYTGEAFCPLNVEKIWKDTDLGSPFTDRENLASLRPDSIEVKLYRQWKISDSQYAWEQVTKPDDNTVDMNAEANGWTQMNAGVLKLERDNKWKLEYDLKGLYKIAPNGAPYEYFVVEQNQELLTDANGGYHGYYAEPSEDKHPNVSNGGNNGGSDENNDGSNNGDHALNIVGTEEMAQLHGYSNSVILNDSATTTPSVAAATKPVNDMLYKEVSYSKQWKKQINGAGETTPLTQTEAEELIAMGALPETLYFVVQYQLGDGGKWYYLPEQWQDFSVVENQIATEDLNKENIKSFVHSSYNSKKDTRYVNADMLVKGGWNYLPAYYQNKKINYRVVEAMAFADRLIICDPTSSKEATNDIISSAVKSENIVNAPKVESTKYDYTNTVKVKPIVLRKIWKDDNANRDNTRPDSITITVKNTSLSSDSNKGIKVELTRANINNNVEITPNPGMGNVYQSRIFYVLASQISEDGDKIETNLEATEIGDITGYTKSETIPLTKVEGKDLYVFTATNTLTNTTRKVIDLTATKTWNGEVNWVEDLRPTIKFTLQYRYKMNNGLYTTWSDATPAATGVDNVTKEVIGKANETSYSVTWQDVNQYFDEDGTAIAMPIEYRVIEKMYNSAEDEIATYIVSGNGIFKPDTDGKPTTTVKNELRTVTVTAVKKWEWKDESGDTGTLSAEQLQKLYEQGVLPRYILFELYYRKSDSESWKKVSENVFAPERVETTQLLRNSNYTSNQKLPKYDKDGKLLQYRLVETGVYFGTEEPTTVGDFTSVSWKQDEEVESGTVGSFDVTVSKDRTTKTITTNTLPVGSLKVTKKWDDMDDRDGLRDEITVNLYRDGNATPIDTVELNAANNWTYTWNDLPVYKNGKTADEANKSVYSVVEVESSLPRGYTVTVGERNNIKLRGDSTGAIPKAEVVNEHEPYTMDISATKVWKDNKNEYGLRPMEVELQLQYRLDVNEEWDIVRYDADGFEGNSEVSFRKVKVGSEAQTIIYAENPTVTLNGDASADTWGTVTWSDLPANAWKAGATEPVKVQYRVVEVSDMNGYICQSDDIVDYDSTSKEVEVTNKLKTTKVTANKRWTNENSYYNTRPDSLTFTLQYKSNGEWIDFNLNNNYPKTSEANKDNNWTVTFDNLPVEDANGNIYQYMVKESDVNGYTQVDTGEAKNSPDGSVKVAEITNELVTVDISGSKHWDDAYNRDNKRPTSITIYLLADGERVPEYGTAEVSTTATAANNWAWSFKGVPKYDKTTGKEITYTVEEEAIEEYTPEIKQNTDGSFVVANSYIPKTLDISAKKVWSDQNDKYGLRPTEVTLQLQYRLDSKETSWEAVRYKNVEEENNSEVYFNGVTGGRANLEDREDPTVTVKDDSDGDINSWETVTWSGLPAYAWKDETAESSVPVEYRVIEVGTSNGYDSSPSGSVTITSPKKCVVVTNSLKGTSWTVQKAWNPKEEILEKRNLLPDSIAVKLQYSKDNGKTWIDVTTEEGTAELIAENNWQHIFTDLRKDYKYQAVEVSLTYGGTVIVPDADGNLANGMTSESGDWPDVGSGSVIGTELTNTLDVTKVTAAKEWEEYGNNSDETRPKDLRPLAFKVQYSVDGENWVDVPDGKDSEGRVKPYTIDLPYPWKEKVTFENLPVKDLNGKTYQYKVVETTQVPGYAEGETEMEGDGKIATITNKLETVDLVITKNWSDDSDRYRTRPEDLELKVSYKNEAGVLVDLKQQPVVTWIKVDDNTWTATLTKLPKYIPGTDIEAQYTVTETVPDGYAAENASVTVNKKHEATLKNELETVKLEITKGWEDENNRYNTRPEDLNLTVLYENVNAEGAVERVGLSPQPEVKWEKDGNTWKAMLTGLPKYIPQTKTEAKYIVREAETVGYEAKGGAEKEVDVDHKVSFINELVIVKVEGSKTWDDHDDQDGKRPEKITIRLYADGAPMTDHVVTVTADDDWKWSFENLPKYNKDGSEIIYTITEDQISDYQFRIDGYDVTNTHTPGKVNVAVTKCWDDEGDLDGVRPGSVTIHLFADGVDTDRILILDKDNRWTGSFDDLDEYKNGQKIVYTVKEDVPELYTADFSGNAEEGFVITNRHTPEKKDITYVSKVRVAVAKSWDDGNDQDKIRPESITIRLLADGIDTGRQLILNAECGWIGSFSDLDAYKGGKKIVYTISEDAVEGYQTAIAGNAETGFVVLNSHAPKKSSVPADSVGTGDSSNMLLWALLLLLSGGIIAVILKKRKKK